MRVKSIFSHRHDNWSTPLQVFEGLSKEFGGFDHDPCSLHQQIGAFTNSWYGKVFINPPYSNIEKFLMRGKAQLELGNAKLCVFLLPARTDRPWFHKLLYNQPNVEVRFLPGRLKFGGSKTNAPFPSMIAIMRKKE